MTSATCTLAADGSTSIGLDRLPLGLVCVCMLLIGPNDQHFGILITSLGQSQLSSVMPSVTFAMLDLAIPKGHPTVIGMDKKRSWMTCCQEECWIVSL